jgi:2-keto-4-pentenoate hydratase/2-oxohepta-3-ene-1,7-dioic acid hydratase in catechol pathway
MKLVRCELDGRALPGVVEEDRVWIGDPSSPHRSYPLAEVKLLAPVEPSKVVAIGLNYRDHAEELNLPLPSEPILFMKPPTTIIGPGDSIRLPPESVQVDFEAELAIVIGQTSWRVSDALARERILGYTCLNDVTARDLQRKDGQWTRAKGFDTFCPLGPWIDTKVDPSDLTIELAVNGEIRQLSRTSNLLFNPAQLVSFVSHVMTLHPGDVIATGTPSGIGPLHAGELVEVRIEGVGVLANPVVSSVP